MKTLTPNEILDLPMPQPNDAEAATIREYLTKLLALVWEHTEGFNGKRPFGNSGWDWDLMTPLVMAGVIEGEIDAEYHTLDDCDEASGRVIIAQAISALAG